MGVLELDAIDSLVWLFAAITHELMLFAGVGLLIGGLDDLLIDLIFLARTGLRALTVYQRHETATAATLAPPDDPGRLAIFIGAWDESEVIGAMLRTALGRIDHRDYRIYVGVYPNDPATIAAVRNVRTHAPDGWRVRMVSGPLAGPTTKAEALNRLWRAMLADEARDGVAVKAIVLHDAEDIVHRDELRVFDRLIERFDLVQLPVLPLIVPGSRWVSGHYCDEFAEANCTLTALLAGMHREVEHFVDVANNVEIHASASTFSRPHIDPLDQGAHLGNCLKSGGRIIQCVTKRTDLTLIVGCKAGVQSQDWQGVHTRQFSA